MSWRYHFASSVENKRECIADVGQRLQALREAEQAEYPEVAVFKPSDAIGPEYNTLFPFHGKIGDAQARCMCVKGGAVSSSPGGCPLHST
jgi:hypothetical protein